MNYNFAWQSVSKVLLLVLRRTFCEDVREAHMFTTELRI